MTPLQSSTATPTTATPTTATPTTATPTTATPTTATTATTTISEIDRVSPIQVRQRSTQPASKAPSRRLVIALYDFSHPSDETYTMLPLCVGDIVTVLKQEGEWLEGEIKGGQRGYFPSSFVGEAPVSLSPSNNIITSMSLALEEFSLENTRRCLAVIELIETERRYVSELQLLQYAVLAPLQRNACNFQFATRKISSFQSLYTRTATLSNNSNKETSFDLHSDLILKHEQIEQIFSNWEAICRFNSFFLTDIENCVKKWCLLSVNERVIGNMLLEYIPRFRIYGEYCANFHKAQLLLAKVQVENIRFIQFQESIKDSGLMEKTLNSYLISPIQRVPRYQMLINEILKSTPASHPDFLSLQEALNAVIVIANEINESVRVQENYELLHKLEASFIYNPRFSSQPRQLRRHGELAKKKSVHTLAPFSENSSTTASNINSNKPPVKRMFFLFDDLLAYASIQTGTRKLLLRGKLLIDANFEIVDRGETELVIKAGKFFQIFFSSVEEKKIWLHDIEICIREQANKRLQAEKEETVATKTNDECLLCKKKYIPSQATTKTKFFTCTYCLGFVCKNCSSKSNKKDDTSKTTVCNTCFESQKPVNSNNNSVTRSFFGMVRGRSRSSKTAERGGSGSGGSSNSTATTATQQTATDNNNSNNNNNNNNVAATQEFFILDCPLGHGLSPKIATEEGYACDVCDEKNIAVGEKLQSCVMCNYYVCLMCQQKPGAVLSASFGSAELIGMMQKSQKTFLERFATSSSASSVSSEKGEEEEEEIGVKREEEEDVESNERRGFISTTSFAPLLNEKINDFTKTINFSPLVIDSFDGTKTTAFTPLANEDPSDTPSAGSADASELVEEEAQIASLETMESEIPTHLAGDRESTTSSQPATAVLPDRDVAQIAAAAATAIVLPDHNNASSPPFTPLASRRLSIVPPKPPEPVTSETETSLSSTTSSRRLSLVPPPKPLDPSIVSSDLQSTPSTISRRLSLASSPKPSDPSSGSSSSASAVSDSTVASPDSSSFNVFSLIPDLPPDTSSSSQPSVNNAPSSPSIVIETASASLDHKANNTLSPEFQISPQLSAQLHPPRRRVGYRSYSFIAPPSATPPSVPALPRAPDRIRHRSLLGAVFGRSRPSSTSSSPLRASSLLDSVREDGNKAEEAKSPVSPTISTTQNSNTIPSTTSTLPQTSIASEPHQEASKTKLEAAAADLSFNEVISVPSSLSVAISSSSTPTEVATLVETHMDISAAKPSPRADGSLETGTPLPKPSSSSVASASSPTLLSVTSVISPSASSISGLSEGISALPVEEKSLSHTLASQSEKDSQFCSLPSAPSTLARSTSVPLESPRGSKTSGEGKFSAQLEIAMSKLSSLVRAQLASESSVSEMKLAQTIASIAAQLAKEFNPPSSPRVVTEVVSSSGLHSPSKKRVPPPPKSARGNAPIQLHMATSPSESGSSSTPLPSTTITDPMVISIRRPPPPPSAASATSPSDPGGSSLRRPPPPPM